MHVLEAVIVASIMLSAVVYVATYDNPSAPSTPTRELLQEKAEDALKILYDTPVVGSAKGDNALSAYLVDCMAGNCTNLTDRLDKLVPAGARYALYVSNGFDTYPVYIVREPTGEAVTATHLLEPKWSHTFVSTARNTVNPTLDPLLVYALPIFNGNVVSEGGSPLRVIAYGHRLSDGSNYTLIANGATQAVASESADLVPTVSLTFLEPDYFVDTGEIIDWIPSAIGHYRHWTASRPNVPSLQPAEMRVRVNHSGGAELAAGTEITVNVPRGWKATADQASNLPHWKILSNATDGNGTRETDDIRAQLLVPLQDASIDLKFSVTYYGDVVDWYAFHAYLSKGALAEASFVVQADDRSDIQQTLRAPAARLSTSRPMGGGATTSTWALSLDVPLAIGSNTNFHLGRSLNGSSTDTRVMFDRIEIIERNGAKIFGSNVQGVAYADKTETATGARGTWTSTGDKLIWTCDPTRLISEGVAGAGDHSECLDSQFGPYSLTFTTTASGVEGSQDKREPFVPPIDFDQYEGRVVGQAAAGFYRQAYLPEVSTGVGTQWKGYDTSAVPRTEFDISTPAIYRTTQLPGSADYVIESVPTPTDALFGSYVSVDTPTVPVGGEVVLNADIQSMLFALADAGQEAGVTLHFYPPWTGDEHKPIHTVTNLDTGFLDSQVTAMLVLDVNGDGYPDPVVGTSNGRVIAMHGLTGARLSGKVFAAPVDEVSGQVGTGGTVSNTVSSVTHLARMVVGGQTYIAIGTGERSGVYVIDLDFKQKWSFGKSAFETVAMDASTDVDLDGRDDLIVAMRKPADATSTYYVYLLAAPSGSTSLRAILNEADQDDLGTATIVEASEAAVGAFFTYTGDPSGLVGMDGVGQQRAPGFAVSMRTVAGLDAQTTVLRHDDPVQAVAETSIQISTPRHGVIGVNRSGAAPFLFFGTPVTTASAYDHDNDPATDLIAGSPAGYVLALNGTMATQPAFPVLYPGPAQAEDAACLDGLRCIVLTTDGTAIYTFNGWGTRRCVSCDPVTGIAPPYGDATGVAINGTSSFWMAGLQSRLWRTTGHPLDSAWPMFEPVAVIPAQQNVLGVLTSVDLAAAPQNFYDVHFLSGADADVGWVAGGSIADSLGAPCVGVACPTGFLMMTEDNGASWRVFTHADDNFTLSDADGNAVRATLLRVNFTTREVGWVAGTAGTLLLTKDGGYRWNGVDTDTTATIRDVACAPLDPDFCLAVGDGGALLKVTGASGTSPAVTNLTSKLPAGVGARNLTSVGLFDRSRAYVGSSNMLLQTLDGGEHWTTLPMGFVESNVNRIVAMPDGLGYGFGGSDATYRVFHIHDFLLNATMRTLGLSSGLDANDEIRTARVKVETDLPPGGAADYYISSNGGASWSKMGDLTSETEVRTEHEQDRYVSVTYGSASIPVGQRGNDLRLRIDVSTSATSPITSPVVRAAQLFQIQKYDGDTQSLSILPDVTIDLGSTSQVNLTATTAVWDTANRTMRLPVATELWTANVSGKVLTVATGHDVSGDWRDEVWVSTGDILAQNSPDYLAYAGNAESSMGPDNAVYLLDGRNGTLLAKSARFPGEVAHLALSDANGDDEPDALFATVSGTTSASIDYTWVVSLDPETLATRWTRNTTATLPTGLGAGKNATGASAAFAGIVPGSRGSGGVNEHSPSRVESVVGTTASKLEWSSLPDERGRYFLNYTIPRNWFFGPYVVEVVVDWKDSVTEGGTSREVLQAARFYDYFMVTPPGSLSPPSPVYNVHLVTWFDDWN